MFEKIADRLQIFHIWDEYFFSHFLETRRMGHQIAQGDGLVVGGRNLEIQVVIDVPIEIQFSLFHLLHYRGPGDQLAD